MSTIRPDKWIELDFVEVENKLHLKAYAPTKARIYEHVATVLGEDTDYRIGLALMELGWRPPAGSKWEKL